MTNINETDVLKKELSGLFLYIQRVRQEIAAISRPADEDVGFESMGDQLDAIVKATEEATDTIMAAMEKNSTAIAALKKDITEPKQRALLDDMENNGQAVFQACSFQDITGQRISKVVKSVTYVEDKVNTLVNVWGKEELEKVEVKASEEKTDDEKLLHGPALESEESFSQSEIDALFD